MTTNEFWTLQQFNYIVTYSFNRGPKLAAQRAAATQLAAKVRKSLPTADAAQLPALREELRQLEQAHGIEMLPLTQGRQAFHVTASPVAVLNKESASIQALADIMQLPVGQQSNWMCYPIYRDALAFYDAQNQLVRVLNVCFDCDKMVTDTSRQVRADTAAYRALRELLGQLGHPVWERPA